MGRCRDLLRLRLSVVVGVLQLLLPLRRLPPEPPTPLSLSGRGNRTTTMIPWKKDVKKKELPESATEMLEQDIYDIPPKAKAKPKTKAKEEKKKK